MKKVISMFAMVVLVAIVAKAQKAGGPVMTFEKTEIDYGTIVQGADPCF